MINLTTNRELNILLNNTNKALERVIKESTPEALKTLSPSKDLKSIMDSVLQETSKGSATNKTLLNLVKNNPTLKNLGSTSQTINDIVSTLKAEKSPLPIEKTLQKFLVDIKDIKEPILKEKLQNSGVFLESKLKNLLTPQLNSKTLINSLAKNLAKSDIFNVKILAQDLQQSSGKNLQNILPKLQEHLKNADSLHNTKLATTLTKLEHLLEPKMLTKENFSPKQLLKVLSDIRNELDKSSYPQAKTSADSFSKLSALLEKNTTLETLTQKALPHTLKEQLSTLKSLINKGDILFSKVVKQDLQTLTSLQKEPLKEIQNNDLKAILHTAKEELSKLDQPKTRLIQQIDKLNLQIDHAQLLSHLSNANSLYLPFSWDAMKEGHISIKKENPQRFNVDIDLNLKEYGALNLKLAIYDKNQLNVHIYTQNKALQGIIKENISQLRSNLISQQITPREIRLFDKAQTKPPSAYTSGTQDIYMGFEVKA